MQFPHSFTYKEQVEASTPREKDIFSGRLCKVRGVGLAISELWSTFQAAF